MCARDELAASAAGARGARGVPALRSHAGRHSSFIAGGCSVEQPNLICR